MKAVPAAVVGVALALPSFTPALGQNSAAEALGAAAQARVAAPRATSSVKPGEGGAAQPTAGDKAAALARALRDGDSLSIVKAGGSAQQVARAMCAMATDPCGEQTVEGPQRGQFSLQRALDLSTAAFVTNRPGEFWSVNLMNGVEYKVVYVRVGDVAGGSRVMFIGDGVRVFAGPWILGPDSPVPENAPR